MEQVIGNISTEWGFYALALYMGVELFKAFAKKLGSRKKNEKTAEAVNKKLEVTISELDKKIDEHIKIDKEHQTKTDKSFLRLEYLRLHSENNVSKNFDALCKIFEEYKSLNGNGLAHAIHNQNIEKYNEKPIRRRRVKTIENENK